MRNRYYSIILGLISVFIVSKTKLKMSVVIETTVGDITVDLFTEERPIACLNFLKLCQLKYYNFNLFHTIEQGFIAQTGDPTGKGDGGSSIWGLVEGLDKRFFEAESLPKIYHTSAGLLSLVSAGKNLVGSQFFLTLGENLSSLDGIHCVIGEVVEGHETLLKLNEAIVDDSFRPYQDIRITHTVVLDDPFPDPRGFQKPSRSPSPNAERLQNGRIAADEDIDDTDGKTMAEIQEMLAEREAKARATILEIVGDLPDAECAPPENVLFVCKLNPVTTDDDLEIIFSRFGKVKGCEVIRDRKTGDSLQYAFVEFEEQKSCEAAYFKMDNVLIDDRRIHVDFSQSVAKVKWRGKGRGVEGSQGRLDFNNLRESYKTIKERSRNGKGNEHRERERMTSEERRKAREERHREQARETDRSKRIEDYKRQRSRSRDISRYARQQNYRERRPSSRERRPSSRERRPSSRERRPSSCERRPSSRERRPSSRERRPSSRERRPSSRERRPSSRERRPSSRERRPSSRERRPSSRERRPSSRERRPSSREGKRSRSRERRYSPQRNNYNSQRDREYRRDDFRDRRQVDAQRYAQDSRLQRRLAAEETSPSPTRRVRSKEPIKDQNKKRGKKAKYSSSSEDSTESSTLESSSDSDSSSEEERKRKKKHSKSKKKKSSNKKSKKHKK